MTLRRLKAVASAALMGAALMAGTGAQASAQTALKVEQGDQFFVDNNDGSVNRCTVGYVDTVNKQFFSAAHCGVAGQRVLIKDGPNKFVKLGTIVYSKDRFNERAWTGIETDFSIIEYSSADAPIAAQNLAQANPFASNVAAPGTVNIGDELCFYGDTTRRTFCHPIREVTDTAQGGGFVKVAYPTDTGAKEGDSGGPMWVPGKGFVGVISREATGNFRGVWLYGAKPNRQGERLTGANNTSVPKLPPMPIPAPSVPADHLQIPMDIWSGLEQFFNTTMGSLASIR